MPSRTGEFCHLRSVKVVNCDTFSCILFHPWNSVAFPQGVIVLLLHIRKPGLAVLWRTAKGDKQWVQVEVSSFGLAIHVWLTHCGFERVAGWLKTEMYIQTCKKIWRYIGTPNLVNLESRFSSAAGKLYHATKPPAVPAYLYYLISPLRVFA